MKGASATVRAHVRAPTRSTEPAPMCSDERPEATCRAITTCVAAIAVLPRSRITASAPKAPNCSGPSSRDTTSIWSIAMICDTTSPTPTMAVPWTEIPAAGVPAVAAAGASPAGSLLTGQSSPTRAGAATRRRRAPAGGPSTLGLGPRGLACFAHDQGGFDRRHRCGEVDRLDDARREGRRGRRRRPDRPRPGRTGRACAGRDRGALRAGRAARRRSAGPSWAGRDRLPRSARLWPPWTRSCIRGSPDGPPRCSRPRSATGTRVVVYDMPLLVENGSADDFDLVVVVHAPIEVRLARLAVRGVPDRRCPRADGPSGQRCRTRCGGDDPDRQRRGRGAAHRAGRAGVVPAPGSAGGVAVAAGRRARPSRGPGATTGSARWRAGPPTRRPIRRSRRWASARPGRGG